MRGMSRGSQAERTLGRVGAAVQQRFLPPHAKTKCFC